MSKCLETVKYTYSEIFQELIENFNKRYYYDINYTNYYQIILIIMEEVELIAIKYKKLSSKIKYCLAIDLHNYCLDKSNIDDYHKILLRKLYPNMINELISVSLHCINIYKYGKINKSSVSIIDEEYNHIRLKLLTDRTDYSSFLLNIFRIISILYHNIQKYNLDIYAKKYIVSNIIKNIYINLNEIFGEINDNEIEQFSYILRFIEPYIDNMYKIYSKKNIINKKYKTRLYKIFSYIFG